MNGPEQFVQRYFAYAHLPKQLQQASRPFGELAEHVANGKVVDEAERMQALRKLLEAKDCFVRCKLGGFKP